MKKLLSLFMVLVFCVTLVPASAFAEDEVQEETAIEEAFAEETEAEEPTVAAEESEAVEPEMSRAEGAEAVDSITEDEEIEAIEQEESAVEDATIEEPIDEAIRETEDEVEAAPDEETGELNGEIPEDETIGLDEEFSEIATDGSSAVSPSEFVAYARTFLGVPYLSGGRSPSGFDCCGLVHYVCNHFGIYVGDIYNTNQVTQITYGEVIPYDKTSYSSVIANMEIGDLIFFNYPAGTGYDSQSVDHVAIYTGNGNIINAESGGVKEHTLAQGGWPGSTAMWESICGIRRVLISISPVVDETYPCYCSITAKSGAKLWTMPCSDSTDASSTSVSLSSAQTLTATALYLNTAGKYWYRVSYNNETRYIYGGNVSAVSPLYDDVSISGISAPSSITHGSTFVIKGIIQSSYTQISEVTGSIGSSISKTVTLGANYYSLQGSSIDNALTFNTLDNGTYTYNVSVKLKNCYTTNGTTISTGTKTKTLISQSFTVSESSHVHSYTLGWEAAHPHREYMKCSCGDYYYTGSNHSCGGHYEIGEVTHQYVYDCGSVGTTAVHQFVATTSDTCTTYTCSVCGYSYSTVTITLNANGGTLGTKNIYYKPGMEVYYSDCACTKMLKTIEPPTKAGYTFSHYASSTSCGDNNDKCYIYGASNASEYGQITDDLCTDITSNASLYAVWERTGTKIEFRTYGFEGALYSRSFNGADIYRAEGYMVIFTNEDAYYDTNSYGTEISVDSTGKVVGVRYYGDATKLQIPEGGFVISGHANGAEDSPSQFLLQPANMETAYVAVDWETMMVKVYSSYNEYLADNKYVENGETYGELPVPEKEGYCFEGWSLDGTPENMLNTQTYSAETVSSTTLIALWSIKGSYAGMAWAIYPDGRLVISKTTDEDYNWENFKIYRHAVTEVIIEADVDENPLALLSLTDYVENVTVDSENKSFCSVDGVLFSASMDSLLYYPPQKNSTYTTPNGVKAIGSKAFSGDSILTSLVLSEGVETICSDSLSGNEQLLSVSIPRSIKNIQKSAFNACHSLETVYYAGTEDQWNAITIESYNDPLTSANIIFATVDTDAPTLTTESKTVCPGQSFTVSVSVANNPGIMAMILTPVYDANVMTMDSVDNGTVFSSAPEQGKNLTWLGDVDTDQNGTLLTYHFTVKEDAAEGNYTVGVSSVTSSDENETPVTFTVTNGTVTVKSIVYGDATGDGEVNIFDLVRLKKYLANYDSDTQTSTIAISGGGDATGNGTIDIFDLVRLKKYLANYDADTKTSTVALGPTE